MKNGMRIASFFVLLLIPLTAYADNPKVITTTNYSTVSLATQYQNCKNALGAKNADQKYLSNTALELTESWPDAAAICGASIGKLPKPDAFGIQSQNNTWSVNTSLALLVDAKQCYKDQGFDAFTVCCLLDPI